MKWTKRLGSLLLAGCIAASALPALAAEADVGETEITLQAEQELKAAASGKCGDNLTWTLDSAGTLTISGTGDMQDYNWSTGEVWYTDVYPGWIEYIWKYYPDGNFTVNNLVIESGVTSIGDCAFMGLNLSSVVIPDGVTSIGSCAFLFTDVKSVTIPSSVTTIEDGAFCEGCEDLKDIYYTGTKKQWKKISFGESIWMYEDNITIHYNSVATPFADVVPDQWYTSAVLWAVNNNVTTGTTSATFSPNNSCTRAQIVTFLWRSAGSPEPTSTSNPFKDVSSSEYYYKAVLWAVEQGITTGTTNTTFSPNATCKRSEAVTFLWRANGKPSASTSNPFKDVTSGQWYTDAVLWAVANSITTGTSKTAFSPSNTCTRAQIVTFLYRAAA